MASALAVVMSGIVFFEGLSCMPTTDSWWERARNILIYDEGVRRKPYKDTVGKLTIGVGRNLDDVPLTNATIYQMLDEDITKAIEAACKIFTQPVFDSWSEARQHAIVNMIFNLGETRFRLFFNMIGAIKLNNWSEAAEHALASKWAKQVGSRSQRIVALLRDEKYIYDVL